MQELKSYLCGQWQRGTGRESALYDPFTGEAIATTSTEGLDLQAALKHARDKGSPNLRNMTFAERGALLGALSKEIYAHRDELLELSRLNSGATKKDGKFDIDGATATMSYYGTLGAELGERTYMIDGEGTQIGRSPRFHGQHIKVPIRGVAIHINAFNFPAWGMAEKLACAFLAGVPVFTKPATATALVAHRISEIMVDSGLLPAGSFSMLCGSVGDLLDHVGPQDSLAFTGSAWTGRKIRGHAKVIEHSVRIGVEADSLNAMVVGPDMEVGSDLWGLFVRELATELTLKTGQKCTATRRVFLPESLIKATVEALQDRLLDIPVGDPSNPEVRMGPLATPAQFKDVCAGMAQLAECCTIVHGEVPQASDTKCAQVQPLILRCDKPKETPTIHELEVFGPCVTLMPYSGDPIEAGELVALGGGGLVATAYSDDLDFCNTLLLELAPWHGRVLLGSKRIAEFSTGPGAVMPQLTHGGPGRAGGGLELGGLRGLDHYMQTCAVQGSRPVIEKLLAK